MTDQERYEIMYDEIVELKNIIKQKDAEIESLSSYNDEIFDSYIQAVWLRDKQIKEAIKEFAERLRRDIVETDDEKGLGNKYPILTHNYIEWLGIVLAIVVGVCVLVGWATNEPQYETQYKVTISDEVSMNEFFEHYEIIDQEGKIYTVREREQVGAE